MRYIKLAARLKRKGVYCFLIFFSGENLFLYLLIVISTYSIHICDVTRRQIIITKICYCSHFINVNFDSVWSVFMSQNKKKEIGENCVNDTEQRTKFSLVFLSPYSRSWGIDWCIHYLYLYSGCVYVCASQGCRSDYLTLALVSNSTSCKVKC